MKSFYDLKYNVKYLKIIILTTSVSLAQYTDVINSNRPSESMSAFAIGQSVFQTEVGLYGISEKNEALDSKAKGGGTDFVMRYGLFIDQLELIANLQFQSDSYYDSYNSFNRTDFKKILFGAKYLLFDPNKYLETPNEIRSWKKAHSFKYNDLIPAITLYAGTNINFPNSPFKNDIESKFSPKIMLITQNQFPDSYVLLMNFFVDKIIGDYINYGSLITVTKGLNQYWSVFLENKITQGKYYSDVIFSTGVAHLLSKNIQVDIFTSKNLKNSPSLFYGGLGFSWRYDGNYKVTLIRKRDVDKVQEKLNKINEKNRKKTEQVQERNIRNAEKSQNKKMKKKENNNDLN